MMASHNFEVGDLVWAKMKGFPPWPGKVSKAPENKKVNDKKPRCYIFFFGTENYAFVSSDNVWPYLEKRDEYSTLPRPSHSFQEAVDAIDDYIREHGGTIPEPKVKSGSTSPSSLKKKDDEDKDSVSGQSRRTRKRQSSVSSTPQKNKSKTDVKSKETPKSTDNNEVEENKNEAHEADEDVEAMKPCKAMKLSEIDVEVRSKKISRKRKDEDDEEEDEDSLHGGDNNTNKFESLLPSMEALDEKSEVAALKKDEEHVLADEKCDENVKSITDENADVTVDDAAVVHLDEDKSQEHDGSKVADDEANKDNVTGDKETKDESSAKVDENDKTVEKDEKHAEESKDEDDKLVKSKVTEDKDTKKNKDQKEKETKSRDSKGKEAKEKNVKEVKEKSSKNKVSAEKVSKNKESGDKVTRKSDKVKQPTKTPDASESTSVPDPQADSPAKKAYLPDVVGTQPTPALSNNNTVSNKQASIMACNKRIGFLGCGNIGEGLIGCLLGSGHKVTVWNRTMAKCKDVLKKGASKGSSPSDVVKSCDIVFACLSDANALKDVVFGNHGALQAMEDNKGFVNLSTVDIETTMDVAEAITSSGGRFLEAPLIGSIESSKSGHMIVLASGDQSLFDECQSCFKSIANNVFNLADITTASKMQIVLNGLYGTTLAGLAESMALACKVGLDPSEVLDVVSHTTVNSALIREKGKAMAKNNLMEPSFRLDTLQKDIRLAINMSEEVDQPLHVGSVVNELFKRAKAKGFGGADVAAVYRAADL